MSQDCVWAQPALSCPDRAAFTVFACQKPICMPSLLHLPSLLCPQPYFVGNAPAGHVQLGDGTTFFHRCQLIQGVPVLKGGSGYSEYVWAAKVRNNRCAGSTHCFQRRVSQPPRDAWPHFNPCSAPFCTCRTSWATTSRSRSCCSCCRRCSSARRCRPLALPASSASSSRRCRQNCPQCDWRSGCVGVPSAPACAVRRSGHAGWACDWLNPVALCTAERLRIWA